MARWFRTTLAFSLLVSLSACQVTYKSNQTLRDEGDRALEKGRLTEAKQAYEAVIERKPEDPVANHGLGLTLLEMEQPLQARTHLAVAYQQSLHDRDRAFIIGTDLAEAMAQSGDLTGMTTFLRDAAELHGEVRDYIRWGDMAAKHGDPDSAELAYRTAVRIETEPTIMPYWKLGLFYENIGKSEQAVRRFRQAYAIEPDNQQIIEKLQTYYSVVGPTLKIEPSP